MVRGCLYRGCGIRVPDGRELNSKRIGERMSERECLVKALDQLNAEVKQAVWDGRLHQAIEIMGRRDVLVALLVAALEQAA